MCVAERERERGGGRERVREREREREREKDKPQPGKAGLVQGGRHDDSNTAPNPQGWAGAVHMSCHMTLTPSWMFAV